MSNPEPTRRDFLRKMTALGALAVGGGALLSACGGGDADDAEAVGGEGIAEASCNDLTGLTEQEIAMRDQLEYVDVSPYPDKICAGCALWIEQEGGAACGGCQVIRGPIAPKGYCNSYAPRQA